MTDLGIRDSTPAADAAVNEVLLLMLPQQTDAALGKLRLQDLLRARGNARLCIQSHILGADLDPALIALKANMRIFHIVE